MTAVVAEDYINIQKKGSGSRGLILLPFCGDYHRVGSEGLLWGLPLELPVAQHGSSRRISSRGPYPAGNQR